MKLQFFFRARFQAAELELELSKLRIPYVLRGGVRFFEQAHIKDVLSYLRVVQNPNDDLAWMRALTKHKGIGAGYSNKIFQSYEKLNTALPVIVEPSFSEKLPPRVKMGFREFRGIIACLLDSAVQDRPDKMINLVLEKGYVSYVRSTFENSQDRLEDLHELMNFAHTYKDLATFLNDISLRESFKGESIHDDASQEEDETQLVLSTIHQAKGLEWKAVFILGLAEGQFPHYKSAEDQAQLEEERRLFYVASTRAKDDLSLLHPMTRYQYDKGTVIARASIFTEELSPSVYEMVEIERSSEVVDDDDDDISVSLDKFYS